LTNVSPSGKALTVHLPRGMPMEAAMRSANGLLDVPLNIFTFVDAADRLKKKDHRQRWIRSLRPVNLNNAAPPCKRKLRPASESGKSALAFFALDRLLWPSLMCGLVFRHVSC
jgi:hypothetical protein